MVNVIVRDDDDYANASKGLTPSERRLARILYGIERVGGHDAFSADADIMPIYAFLAKNIFRNKANLAAVREALGLEPPPSTGGQP